MCIILNNNRKNLRKASGEELLLLAVLGDSNLKPQIDQELDRRARISAAGGRGVVPHPIPMFSGFSGHAA